MMVNPDGYNKTLNHRKILRKAQKIKNLLKIKRILKPKYKLSGGPVFTISLPGLGWGRLAPLPSVTYATGKKCLRGISYYEWLNKIIFSRFYLNKS